MGPPSRLLLGTTFSQLQCHYLGLEYRAAFKAICGLGIKRVRLCAYWHELEPQPNAFQFTTLDWLLDTCAAQGLEVVLAVGMKVPRWPEFHFPAWLQDSFETGAGALPLDQRLPAVAEAALRMLEAVVAHARYAPALRYWQVENEPLTRLQITGGRFLSQTFVAQEVALVRRLALPKQKLLLTGSIALPWGQAPADQQAFQFCLEQADAVGINVYSKVPLGQLPVYLQPQPPFWQRLQYWQVLLTTYRKEAWITEAQAEPWEPRRLVAVDKLAYPSASPQQATALVQKLIALNYSTILLWGCEYWYWHYRQGRTFWWQAMQQLLAASETAE